jgi:serine/threonine protein kinase
VLIEQTEDTLILDWLMRFNICMGIARGLAYLHEEVQPRIIHRNIKLKNILLDNNFNPKIADFGLVRLFPDGNAHPSTLEPMVGTKYDSKKT